MVKADAGLGAGTLVRGSLAEHHATTDTPVKALPGRYSGDPSRP